MSFFAIGYSREHPITMTFFSPKIVSVISSIGAGILWGTWAYFANLPASNALTSAFTQGVFSLFFTGFVSWLLIVLSNKFEQQWNKLIYPPFLVTFQTIVLLLIIHSLVGTANILKTIVVPTSVGFVYGFVICYLKSRET